MMRRPTPNPLEWWQAAVVDPTTPRHEEEPHAGFYTRRAIKGGPLIPVRLHLVQEVDPETGELMADERITSEELGQTRDPMPLWMWTHLRPIMPGEYRALVEAHRTDPRMSATHAAITTHETPTRPRRKTYA